MVGSRGRIGGMSPTVMEIVPYDLCWMAPEGVRLVGSLPAKDERAKISLR